MDRFDTAREQQINDEWRDWIGRSTEYLRACASAVPVAPEVQAILDAWDNGSDEQPWQDAGSDGEGVDFFHSRTVDLLHSEWTFSTR